MHDAVLSPQRFHVIGIISLGDISVGIHFGFSFSIENLDQRGVSGFRSIFVLERKAERLVLVATEPDISRRPSAVPGFRARVGCSSWS